ncbi:DNA-binding NarL/FixJ family response regulator [Pseudoclavibacter chungangensis]|nr:response regulator transcription factor [Pseudoclavibacter chungangensis]NYJ67419.1 DNA-binding NarL/FixJ family response regulator [Pseudoclavibacter chungangensis]
MIRVLVVDDQTLVRGALVALLDTEDDIEVIGEAADGRAALALVRRLHPDVVLMDIRMPGTDGIEATRAIRADATLATSRVLVLTTFEEDEHVFDALREGAAGFLGKGAEPSEIARGVRAVHGGESLLSPAAATTDVARMRDLPPPEASSDRVADLTARELEVLTLGGRGRSNEEIAATLVISPHTAKTHVKRIMLKLGAHDRARLVIIAYESGLLRPGR